MVIGVIGFLGARTMRQRKRSFIGAQSSIATPMNGEAPPSYSINGQLNIGVSPPPSYEDALLDAYYNECMISPCRR